MYKMRKRTRRVEKLAKKLDLIEDYVEASLVLSIVVTSVLVSTTMILLFFSRLQSGALKTASGVIEILGVFLTLALIFSLASGPIRRLEGKKVLPWITAAATISLIGALLRGKFNPLEYPIKGGKTYAVFLIMFSAILLLYLVVDQKEKKELKDIIE